jgi:hypothetical protein
VLVHALCERARDRAARQQVVLSSTVTIATLQQDLQHPAGIADGARR